MLRIDLFPALTSLQLHLLYGGALIAVSIALLAFVTSEVTRNYSQIDKLWSIVPPVFAWYFAAASGWEPRLVLMAVLATAWGARLTFNFWRRGGYSWPPWSGVEDYRWAVLRASPLLAGPWRWRLFNLGFVSLYQVLLLLLITLPSVAAAGAARPLNLLDAGAAALFIGVPAPGDRGRPAAVRVPDGEAPAPRAGEPLDGDMARGFRTSGLFGWRATRTSPRSRRSGARSTCSASPRPDSGSTGRSSARCCSSCSSRAARSSPRRSRSASIPSTPSTARRVPRFLPRPWARRPVF